MSTSREIHSKNSVAWTTPCPINRFVGVGARVGLGISMVGMKKFAGTRDSKTLDAVDIVLTAIITIVFELFFGDFFFGPKFAVFADTLETWVTLGIFVRED